MVKEQHSDIIFALATPSGRGALHLHRISGPGCLNTLRPWLRFRKTKNPSMASIRARHAHYIDIVSPRLPNTIIDDGILLVFEAGASFTGEESIEISTHGNPLISAAIQGLFRQIGFRDALPGEFTQRAFLNGRLDLTQAEAVRTLIDAQTEDGVALARAGSDGAIEKGLQPIRSDLLQARALLEAQIDFAEDEVGSPDWNSLADLCKRIATNLASLEASYGRGRLLLEGVSVALIGPPNAGKSSLYNALLAENRAIVSSEMGTTRDVLKERFRICSRDFILLDTAGIRETSHEIELLGIERSLEVARQAHILVLVVDITDQVDAACDQFLEMLRPNLNSQSEIIVAFNKIDKLSSDKVQALIAAANKRLNQQVIATQASDPSCLEEALVLAYDRITQSGSRTETGSLSALGATLISQRQRDAAASAKAFAQSAHQLCLAKDLPEIIASELLACENSLHELLGRIPPEEVLMSVFGQFCIGK